MTSTTAPVTMTSPKARSDRLQVLLLIDAATCATTGAVAIAAAGPVADLIGSSPAWVRGTGLFLVVYSIALWSLTRARSAIALRRGAAATAVGDGLWVGATIALVVAGAFSGAGIAVMGAVGLVVAALGTAKADTIRG